MNALAHGLDGGPRGRMIADVLPFVRPSAMPIESTPPDHRDDADWGARMARAQAGDREAYRTLLRDLVPYVRAIARRHLGAGDGLDDAVQEVLAVLHAIRHTYEPGRPFKPWLATIASRRCIDLRRQRARRPHHEPFDDAFEAVDTADSPEAAVLRDDRAARVRRAVATLPPAQRRAIGLVHLGDATLGEAAAASGQTAGGLKVACHRAMHALRRALGPEEDA